MPTLKDILCTQETRPRLLRDASGLVDAEVQSKSGISGIAIKTVYKTVTALKPGLVEHVLDNLIERFIDRLEPFYAEWDQSGRKVSFDAHLIAKKSVVANALLTVTDERARAVDNRPLVSAYEKLRPQGEKNVEQAVPGLGRVIAKYL